MSRWERFKYWLRMFHCVVWEPPTTRNVFISEEWLFNERMKRSATFEADSGYYQLGQTVAIVHDGQHIFDGVVIRIERQFNRVRPTSKYDVEEKQLYRLNIPKPSQAGTQP